MWSLLAVKMIIVLDDYVYEGHDLSLFNKTVKKLKGETYEGMLKLTGQWFKKKDYSTKSTSGIEFFYYRVVDENNEFFKNLRDGDFELNEEKVQGLSPKPRSSDKVQNEKSSDSSKNRAC